MAETHDEETASASETETEAPQSLDGSSQDPVAGSHEGMQTRTYPMSVLVATAAVAGLLGTMLGFTASLASVGYSHHKGHGGHHVGAKDYHGSGHGSHGGMAHGYCLGEGTASSMCESKDDPETPVPDFPWKAVPQPSVTPDTPKPVPTDMPDSQVDPAAKELAETIVSERLTVDEATRVAEEQGFLIRIIEVDGVGRPMTMDYRFDRINVAVEDGVVIRADVG